MPERRYVGAVAVLLLSLSWLYGSPLAAAESPEAVSWTPSLESCLERGGRYAWSVRAEGAGGASEWSAPLTSAGSLSLDGTADTITAASGR